MARHAPGPKPGSHVECVPRFMDNDKDAAPVTITVRAPSWGEQRDLTLDPRNPYAWPVDDSDPPSREKIASRSAWTSLLLERFVVAVKNYSARGVAITDAATLLADGETAIINEVGTFIFDLLYMTAEEAKPSAGPSSSSPQTIRPSDGTAASVDAQVKASSATATVPTATQHSSTSPVEASS